MHIAQYFYLWNNFVSKKSRPNPRERLLVAVRGVGHPVVRPDRGVDLLLLLVGQEQPLGS